MIQKYSDGSCAKWYYNTNNNITDGEEEYTVHRKEPVKYFDGEILHGTNDLLDRLNEYECENEKLKQEVENIKDVNVRCCNDYSHYRRENEQLKSDKKQYEILVKSLKDENQKLKLRLKDLGVEYY